MHVYLDERETMVLLRCVWLGGQVLAGSGAEFLSCGSLFRKLCEQVYRNGGGHAEDEPYNAAEQKGERLGAKLKRECAALLREYDRRVAAESFSDLSLCTKEGLPPSGRGGKRRGQ